MKSTFRLSRDRLETLSPDLRRNIWLIKDGKKRGSKVLTATINKEDKRFLYEFDRINL